ncbi:MAG: metallopeptidase TldD-related protein, partial [Pseudomonadota bacterium]
MSISNTRELEPIINKVLELAKAQGASEAEADIGVGSGLSATVRMRELEKIEHERDKAMHITVYMDGRKGSSSTSDFNLDSLKKSVEAACAIAAHTSVDDCAGLVDAELMATEFPELDLYHPWNISPEEATELAIDCETLALDADDRITNADGTLVTTYSGSHLYANSHGFCNGWDWSSHTVDCTVIAKTENGMQRDGWYSKHCDSNSLESIEAIAKESARRCVNRLDAKKLTTRNVPVIYEATVSSSLFSPFITAISGGSLYRQASFMLDKKGEKIFADHITLSEDPHRLKALGSAPFDNDGVATKARDIV